MTFDPKKPFRQRNGRKAWLIADLREHGLGASQPLIVGLDYSGPKKDWSTYRADGGYCFEGQAAHPKGWECPKCGRVYAPTHPQCDACNNKVKATEKEV